MSLKMVQGHSHDINFDPKRMERWKRDAVGREYASLKAKEIYRLAIFWAVLGLALLSLLLAFFDALYFIPAVLLFFFAIHCHFNYLKAWSKWNKYSRKTLVRMDLPKQDSVIVGPKVPWVGLKGVRKGL